MPLTKEQIIEIQTAAKYNTLRRKQEQEEANELKKQVADALKEAKPESKKSDKKGQ